MLYSAYLVSVIGAAAFRVILGSDVGLGYDTTAVSTHRFYWLTDDDGAVQTDENGYPIRGEQRERTPWELVVRPDVMVAVFNSRHYGYLEGDGSFTQPFHIDYETMGDNPEGNGNLELGARLRLGRRLLFHPGVFVRLASSNLFLEAADLQQSARIQGRPFNALCGGGWLEFEAAIRPTTRFLFRVEAEFWNLEFDPESLFYIPSRAREVQPNLLIRTQGVLGQELNQLSEIAIELGLEEDLYFEEPLHPSEYEGPADDAQSMLRDEFEQQHVITGRVVYQRAWLPNLRTTLALGVLALRPRESTQVDQEAVETILAGGWQLSALGEISLSYFGRPRWLSLNLSYRRSYDQLDFREMASAYDAVTLIAAFGPFSGVTLMTTLSWTRAAVSMERLRNGKCPSNSEGCVTRDERIEETVLDCDAYYDGSDLEEYVPEQCDHQSSWTRTFNTLGFGLDLRYTHERGNVLFGPFLEGYLFTQIIESLDKNEINQMDEGCGRLREPYLDDASCYLPRHQSPFEAIVMLGFRLQWGAANARDPRRGLAADAVTNATRAERRITFQRMTREERRVLGYGYQIGSYGTDESIYEEIMGNDPEERDDDQVLPEESENR